MVTLADLNALLQRSLADWQSVRVAELVFGHRDTSRLMVVVLLSVSAALLVGRSVRRFRPGRNRVVLPAILPVIRTSRVSFVRHGTLLLFLAGLPFFLIALADPYTSITHQEVSYPGRRIAILIDASSSMMEGFKTNLAKDAPSDARFFTAVAAAKSFVQLRIKRKYHDLMALIEFGDQSYVITPFTTDYDNILLSISLISDLTEFNKFPDQGTTIGMAIDQGVNLFKAFDFLTAAGNLLVVFSDGDDVKTDGPRLGNQTAEQILSSATKAKIPVHFIRTALNRKLGQAVGDPIWRPVVEKTGGKYYAAFDEATIVKAIEDIDRATAAGKVVIKQYSTQQPRFSVFALAAVGVWSVALALKLTFPYFNKFP